MLEAKLPDGKIITATDQTDLDAKVKALGIENPVYQFTFKGVVISVIEKS